MASTYTLNNGIELIGTGEQSGTWGDTTNTNLELIDTALDGQISLTLSSAGSSGSPNSLPVSDGASSNGRNRLISYVDGGDLGATAFVQLTPNDAEKIIYIRNALSGSRSIIVFQGTYNASNDYEIPAGTTAVVYFNGGGTGAVAANVFNNAYFDGLRLGSVSVTAILDEDNMSSNSATALSTQQSIKAYVDAQVGAFDSLAEVLAVGNTTGGTDLLVSTGDDITFADNSKAIFGAGSDLQIYHDGSNSRIDDTGTGDLIIRGSSSIYIGKYTGENMAVFNADGAVDLRYNNDVKFVTTNNGIDVTGTVTADGLTVDGNGTTNVISSGGANDVLAIKSTDNTSALSLVDTNGSAKILTQSDGRLHFYRGGDANSITGANSKLALGLEANGDISFYEDTGTTAKFFWDSSAESLGIGTSSPEETLSVMGDFQVALNTSVTGRGLKVSTSNTSITDDTVTMNAQAATGILAFQTNSAERMRIDSSGNVGIGKVPPTDAHATWSQLFLGEKGSYISEKSNSGGIYGNFVTDNLYIDADTGAFANITTDQSSAYRQEAGVHHWYSQASGSAGAAVTLSEKMRIDSSGNVGIGVSSPSAPLHVKSSTGNAISLLEHASPTVGTGQVSRFVSSTSNITDVIDSNGYYRIGSSTNPTTGAGFTERMRIDSSGNVGIGVSSPTLPLDIVSNSGADALKIRARPNGDDYGTLTFYNNAGTTKWADIQSNVAKDLRFYTNGGSERMRIDSSGNVGIGSPPAYNLHIEKAGNQFIFLNNASTNDGFYFKAGSGASSIQTNGGSNVMNFFTSGNERMRIDSDGVIIVNKTGAISNTFSLNMQAKSAGGIIMQPASNASFEAMRFVNFGLTAAIGNITCSTTSTSFNTSSDYRLKENVVDLTGASARVNQLDVKRFNFIADETNTLVDGFLAHEVATVVPEAITGTKDAMMDEEYEVTPAVEATYDEDGNELTAAVEAVMGTRSVPVYQGIDQSKLVPLLTAALQEALAKIDAMETRLTALEG